MPAVHNQNSFCFAAEARVNEHTALLGFLPQPFDRSRLRADNCNHFTGRYCIAKADVDQLHGASPPLSLKILDLLPDLFDLRLDIHHMAGNLNVVAFGADGVGLPVKFLYQEVQLTAHGAALAKQFAQL